MADRLRRRSLQRKEKAKRDEKPKTPPFANGAKGRPPERERLAQEGETKVKTRTLKDTGCGTRAEKRNPRRAA